MDRPVLRYFGGKFLLAPWIISHMPKHRVYVEPFGGAASVLMQKPRSYAEIYNDLDSDVVNLFRVLQNHVTANLLVKALENTPFAREEFNLAYAAADNSVEQARRLIIRSFMGFGANGHNPSERTGFRANSNRSGSTPAGDWANYLPCLEQFRQRLKGVVIENRDALEVMAQQDSPSTLHFVDPPYVHCTRGVTKAYIHEMTDKQHEDLCIVLDSLEGMVMLCGYQNEIYKSLEWHRIDRDALADGARERTESLWLNDAAYKAKPQADLFAEVASQ